MLVVICGIRKMVECVFSKRELRLLDDLLPESNKQRRRASQARGGTKLSDAAASATWSEIIGLCRVMLFIFHFKFAFEQSTPTNRTRTSTKDCSSPTLMGEKLLGMFKLLCGGPFHVFITSWEAGAQPAPSRRDHKLCFGQNEVWSSLTNERGRARFFHPIGMPPTQFETESFRVRLWTFQTVVVVSLTPATIINVLFRSCWYDA